MPRRFDRFMVDVEIGRSLKLARLTVPERLCHIVGVLAVAAKAPVRGCLLVGEHEATAAEVALQSSVSVAVARSTLSKLQDAGVLERDEELDCWRVHDWSDYNPEPKRDATNAERQRRYRERRNARRNAVTPVTGNGSVTARNAREVEVEVEAPLGPPEGEALDNARDRLKRQRDEKLQGEFDEWLADHEKVTGRTAPAVGTKARDALLSAFTARRSESYTLEQLKLATRGAHDDDYRREHGYDRAESVLRPSKVHDLAINGERLARGTGKTVGEFVAGFGAKS
jgi:hypothetical protein